jgi:DnaJ-class molecular chaperone with C-terminal Zn finger domain
VNKEEAAEILGVNVGADEEEIEERFRVMVKKNHPDQGGSPSVFKRIQSARETLLTEEREENTRSTADSRASGNREESRRRNRTNNTGRREDSGGESEQQGNNHSASETISNEIQIPNFVEFTLDKIVKEHIGKSWYSTLSPFKQYVYNSVAFAFWGGVPTILLWLAVVGRSGVFLYVLWVLIALLMVLFPVAFGDENVNRERV